MRDQMDRKIEVFNVTRIGSGHIKHDKPCQDASMSWESEDGTVQIAIVSDGHGGDTYVRSDVGSKLAVSIAMRHLVEMSRNPVLYGKLMFQKKGEVTARPTSRVKLVDSKNPTESELQQIRQDNLFVKQYRQNEEQDKVIGLLFKGIVDEWHAAITKDCQENPLSEYESGMLGGNRIEKAYGATLLAFMRTPYYWFAFQIGDGKMLCCDETLTWREPVPWDCNCFLNMTTSLCNRNPLPSFRYAYDGTGTFPMAVVMGSDGLDDSWVTMQNLQDFYAQTLKIFLEEGKDKTVEELAEYLSKLSQRGSHDDMSMAGIVDLSLVGEAVKMYDLRKEGLVLQTEFQNRKKEIEKYNAERGEIEKRLIASEEQLKKIERQRSDIEALRTELAEKKELIEKKTAEYSSIDAEARARNGQLREQWSEMKDAAVKAAEVRKDEWLHTLGDLPWETVEEIGENQEEVTSKFDVIVPEEVTDCDSEQPEYEIS